MKAMAVFAFMLTDPGTMLVNDPTSNAHPANTAIPDAVTVNPANVLKKTNEALFIVYCSRTM
jgi:type IV secretory pathway TrbF-like protein